jgi:hypothetical protein
MGINWWLVGTIVLAASYGYMPFRRIGICLARWRAGGR